MSGVVSSLESGARGIAGWKLLLGLLVFEALASSLTTARSATYSLADDFSYSDNRTNSTWAYRLDDVANISQEFLPLLSSTNRDANSLWGSDFPTPPLMWSEASGYWGIGKNLTGQEQFSARNGTRWAPGEVLLHPKGGASPAPLVISWTAPRSMVIDLRYIFGRGSPHGNGIGYKIIKRTAGGDSEVIRLKNIGNSLTNDLMGLGLAKGDLLFFRFDTDGDPTGDITRAAIEINDSPLAAGRADAIQPSGCNITAGSEFTFTVPTTAGPTFQWHKDGQSIPRATGPRLRISGLRTSDEIDLAMRVRENPYQAIVFL